MSREGEKTLSFFFKPMPSKGRKNKSGRPAALPALTCSSIDVMLFGAAAPASAVDAAAALSLQSFPRAPPSPSLEELSLSLGISYDAVASIYSQGAQLAAAGPHARARREAGSIAEKFAEAIIGDDAAIPPTATSCPSPSSSFAALDALSSAARVPAALLLRRVLESAPFSVPRTAITDFMRCPRALAARASATGGGGGGATSTAAAAPPPPPRLLAAAADAAAAASALDPLYSPRGDALRHVAGAEAEALLCARLRSAGGGAGGGERWEDGRNENEDDSGGGSSSGRGVPFWTEGALRAGGFALTPDVRLATPVALPCGHVVHWIDSKATFGTVRMHE